MTIRGEGRRTPQPARLKRLFIAVPLSTEWIEALAAAQHRLRDTAPSLRFVRPDGIHLTLHFLGATAETRVAALDQALRRAAAAAHAFDLALGAPGTFGARRRPRVVWAGFEGPAGPLQQLHQRIARELAGAAFPVDPRPFRPHLTLARVPDRATPADAAQILAAVDQLQFPPVATLHADHVALIESHLGPGGARYERLALHRLAAAPADHDPLQ